MKITEQIEELFENGVVNLTIGTTPQNNRFVQIMQIVPTGPGKDHMQCQHQTEGKPLSEMLATLRRQVDHTNDLKTNILTPNPNGR